MIRLKTRIAQFSKGERGTVTIEFVLCFIAMMAILSTAIELGVVTVRQTVLDSRLDAAMRNVRINTGAGYSHSDLVDMICEDNALFGECEQNLRLEMTANDPRNYTPFSDSVSCVNREVAIDHPDNTNFHFTLGQANELVMVRACMLYDPILPSSLMALARTTTEGGRSALVSVSAFTQEPR